MRGAREEKWLELSHLLELQREMSYITMILSLSFIKPVIGNFYLELHFFSESTAKHKADKAKTSLLFKKKKSLISRPLTPKQIILQDG